MNEYNTETGAAAIIREWNTHSSTHPPTGLLLLLRGVGTGRSRFVIAANGRNAWANLKRNAAAIGDDIQTNF